MGALVRGNETVYKTIIVHRGEIGMKNKEFEAIIDQEVKWCEEHESSNIHGRAEFPEGFEKGFVAGLKQALFLHSLCSERERRGN